MRPSLHQDVVTLAIVASAALCACGDPGVATPMPEPPTIDLMGVGGREYAGAATAEDSLASFTFDSPRGATTPGARIRATNLDATTPVSNSFARLDGSFSVTLLAEEGDTLRLQAVLDGLRGPPVDIVHEGGNEFSPVTLPPCLGVTPGLALTFDDGAGTKEMTVSSTCAGTVSLENPRARLSLTDFTLETPLPVTVEPGGEVTLEIRFSPVGPGEREDVLFLDALGADAAPVRYPITVFGGGE